jgi:hypothetical protein
MFLFFLMFGGVLLAPFAMIFGVFAYSWVFLYFFLGRHVQRGRRWAIGMSLVLAVFLALMSIAGIVLFRTGAIFTAIIQTLVLLVHLNLIKHLVQSWAVSRRIDALIQPAQPGPHLQEELLELD